MARENRISSFVEASSYTSVASARNFLASSAEMPGGRKIRSFIWEDRKSRDCTPRTKEMASIRLDLPEPLGPMTEVKSWKGPILWVPA
eukprot:3310209-Ditylum_brightwellii.AAC.1